MLDLCWAFQSFQLVVHVVVLPLKFEEPVEEESKFSQLLGDKFIESGTIASSGSSSGLTPNANDMAE